MATVTPIASIGEFGLIHHLTQHFKNIQPNTLLGIGDDAAIIQGPGGQDLLISTDSLVEGIHFDLSYYPLKHLGYKAVTTAISDIVAMNGTPSSILVSLALSSKYTVEAITEIYAGIATACNNYQLDLIGGDTTASPKGLVINVTAIGTVDANSSVKRSGAQVNDLVAVTGDLGGAYLGLQLLEREKSVFLDMPDMQPELAGNEYVLARQLRPEARTDMKAIFKQLGIQPSSMIDISDGLASEMLHLCQASKLGCHIQLDKIPYDPTVIKLAKAFNLSPSTCALNGGEDYELLFTIPVHDYQKIENHPDITIIGYMCQSDYGCKLEQANGTLIDITAQGWNHFQKPDENN